MTALHFRKITEGITWGCSGELIVIFSAILAAGY